MLSEILTSMLRSFFYTDFFEGLNAFTAEGTIIVRTTIISLLKLLKDVPRRHSGFRMTAEIHVFVNNSYIYSVLFLLPLASA